MDETDKKEHLNKKAKESYQRNKHKRLERARLYYQKNKDKLNKQEKERRKSNPEVFAKRRREYYIENREKELKQARAWHQNNKEKVSAQKKEWRKKNPKYMNEYNKSRSKTDPTFKLARTLRSRIGSALREGGSIKGTGSEELLGCTIKEAREYLETLFQEGMTWDNNTKRGWHVDHIVPCAAFDLTNKEEQKKCFHYTNLRPLWCKENESKGSLHEGIRHKYKFAI